MTRGNQRELARERNLKKQQQQKKSQPHQDGVKLDNRMERDADIMRKKQEAAAAKKAAEEAAARAEKNKKLMYSVHDKSCFYLRKISFLML
ncbi:4F5 family protein [Brugia pahangi]